MSVRVNRRKEGFSRKEEGGRRKENTPATEILKSNISQRSISQSDISQSEVSQGESHFMRVPWCEEGYYLQGRPQFTFDPLFHAGCYYVQEASSMFITHILRTLQGILLPPSCVPSVASGKPITSFLLPRLPTFLIPHSTFHIPQKILPQKPQIPNPS